MSFSESAQRSFGQRVAGRIGRQARSAADAVAGIAGYHREKRVYQDTRFPGDQYNLISQTDAYKSAKSTLEIGCNKGKLVQRFAADGKFSVGLDLEQYWAHANTQSAVLGVLELTLDNVEHVPEFDVVCVLSVHHQWVRYQGEEYARKLMHALQNKARIGLFVEFAALADKYGYQPGSRFVDNEEQSVVAYAQDWLGDLGSKTDVSYLGSCRELEVVEPYRFMLHTYSK
ncbi:MAG: hypothetical protein AAF468_04595 [Pseudomonadota bacterium]